MKTEEIILELLKKALDGRKQELFFVLLGMYVRMDDQRFLRVCDYFGDKMRMYNILDGYSTPTWSDASLILEACGLHIKYTQGFTKYFPEVVV